MAKEVVLARQFWASDRAVVTARVLMGIVLVDSAVFAIEGMPIYHCWWLLSLFLLTYPCLWSWRKLNARHKELRGF